MRTVRPLSQAVRTYFPGAFFVYRNLSLRVRDNGVTGNPLPFRLQARLIPDLVGDLRALAATDPQWREFGTIDEDRVELTSPSMIEADVEPTTWWCGNCGELLNGPLARVGIRDAACPSCHAHRVVQMNAIFMCSVCHQLSPVAKALCLIAMTHRMSLRGVQGGVANTDSAAFGICLNRHCCLRDRVHNAMTLKAPVVGCISLRHRGSTSKPRSGGALGKIEEGRVTQARADVVVIVVGRISCGSGAYYRRREA